MISLRCSDLQTMHWENVTEYAGGPSPALRRYSSFTAIKGPEGGVAAEVVVLMGGVDETSEVCLCLYWYLNSNYCTIRSISH